MSGTPATGGTATPQPVLLAEYQALRSEITTLLSLQGQFLNFSIAFLGFVIAIANREPGLANKYLTLLPIPFGIFGLSYADIAFRIMRAAHYIQHRLRPQLEAGASAPCLGWESYIRDDYPARGLMTWMDRLRWSFFIGPASAFTFLAFYRGVSGAPWWSRAAWLLSLALVVVNLVVLLVLLPRHAKRVTQG